MNAPHADRLWDLSQQRADEIGKQLKDIAAEAGVSDQTVYKWRKGRAVAGRTDIRIHQALLWAPGSRQAILDGGDPTPLAGEPREESTTPEVNPQVRALLAFVETLPAELQIEVARGLQHRMPQPPEPGDRQRPTG